MISDIMETIMVFQGRHHDFHLFDKYRNFKNNKCNLYVQKRENLESESACAFIRNRKYIKYIQGVPGGTCQTSGECSLC
jgi:hypothetical protein